MSKSGLLTSKPTSPFQGFLELKEEESSHVFIKNQNQTIYKHKDISRHGEKQKKWGI